MKQDLNQEAEKLKEQLQALRTAVETSNTRLVSAVQCLVGHRENYSGSSNCNDWSHTKIAWDRYSKF